ncbi:MAG: hypothetical protein JSR48_05705 [Verrucomicrobia bacterium]|nr:hypothetical protein [Verrucomicrobiota bacterium]
MKRTLAHRLVPLLLAAGLALAPAHGAESRYGLAADNHILAQKIVNGLVATHPELLTAGMHCVPPDGAAQTIIASTLNVIGKRSDPPDVEVGARGETIISPNLKIPKLGIMLPLRDQRGREIGALALAFKYRAGEDQVKYLAEATAIRDQVARQIPALAALFTVVH